MRKLVTVRKISEIRTIDGADNIVTALIDGWDVIVKKDEFNVGDYCVYFEIDSFIPDVDRFEFLRSSSFKRMGIHEGFRLKSRKLRGVVSQGLALPMSAFPELAERITAIDGEYVDFSEDVGVVKYEPPIPVEIAGQPAGNFPQFIPKTDQDRCQNIGRAIFDHNAGATYEVSLKLDGSSMTAYRKDGHTGVCSRNWELKVNEENENNVFVKLFNDINMAAALNAHGRNIAVQGELMGPGIQGNREKLDEHHLYVFDIYDIDKRQYLSPKERLGTLCDLYDAGLNAKLVHHTPIICTTSLEALNLTSTRDLVGYADGPSLTCKIREGVVFKRDDGAFSFKAISNKFLLKSED